MAHKAIRPAATESEPQDFVPHDIFLANRRTGVLEVRWKIDPAHPVVIGAGWLRIDRKPAKLVGPMKSRGPQIELVAEIARRGPEGLPVLPGSSIKGAVRQVYELLTPSCRLEWQKTCQVKAKQKTGQVCPACSLFGAAGLGGRLAFGEASPEGEWQVRQVRTPTAWNPRVAPPATVRSYDLNKAVSKDGSLRKEVEAAWSVTGQFRSRLRLVNVSEGELGVLFAALGLGAEESPMLRLGGRKFHGLGAVDVEVAEVRWSHPEAERRSGGEAATYARRLAEEALKNQNLRRAWDDWHRNISTEH